MAKRIVPGGDWTDLHRQQLARGPFAPWERFGVKMVWARPRGECDFEPSTMDLAELCWREIGGEILAAATDPQTVWAYRRFGHPTEGGA